MALSPFHPIIATWFTRRFGAPTEAQSKGWPAILAYKDTLIAAPTGSGKTLAAFLACLDRLLREGIAGPLSPHPRVLYISPLKALSNDVQRNLQTPLEEIRALASAEGIHFPEIRIGVRTGDTPQNERRTMLRKPPHILITTPESLYLLLTAESSRKLLTGIETVIVDEIHALARDKRGAHLSLSLARLDALCEKRPVRIGLSATQKPIERMAQFLVGADRLDAVAQPLCTIIDTGHLRELDLAIESPLSPLSAVCSNAQWKEVYEQLGAMIQCHRSTLIFVNTRRLSERVTHNLSELIGEEHITSHHGSLSKKSRLSAEQRLKSGELKAIVATASLELGIDIGYIDLVIQIGSPRAIATFLQRIGRSGHALGKIPKGRLIALTRDELLESIALIRAVRAGRLDQTTIPKGPLDILAQQIVALCAAEEWDEAALFTLVRKAFPYGDLEKSDFDALLTMLSEGIPSSNGRKGAHLYRDQIQGRLKARRGARIAALTSGGAIPDLADYKVVAEPDRITVGSVDEDFAIESLAGDVFLLGNTSWRIQQVRSGEVIVHDAHGAAPTIPFWRGEAPSRTAALSQEVSDLRQAIAARLDDPKRATQWLMGEAVLSEANAEACVDYLAAQQAATGMIPTADHLLFERFFDESGGMQLVIHSPLGGRVNRAYGLALRKRFCRRFDFELQASADDNGLVLSLGPQQGFALEEVMQMIRPEGARAMLTQALLPSPFFQNRWRWNTTRALVVLRQHGGKRTPPPLQRFRADDLLTNVFPALTACPDNGTYAGNIDIPDHPLIRQTVHDVLHEAMDVDSWLSLIENIVSKNIAVTCIDTREPSPFSYQLLNAQPYAFLDGAPLEERRARAVATRRTLSVESLHDLGHLDPEAIRQVRSEAWPLIRDADELHDFLLSIGLLPEAETTSRSPLLSEDTPGTSWGHFFETLRSTGRASRATDAKGLRFWIAAESTPMVQAVRTDLALKNDLRIPEAFQKSWDKAEAWVHLVRGRMDCIGPCTASALANTLGLPKAAVDAALERLEGEGAVLRGRFTQGQEKNEPGETEDKEYCARHLLARIHRLTLNALRQQMAPVTPEALISFLLEWQHTTKATQRRGREGLLEVIASLQGFEIPAVVWERHILPTRVSDYKSQCLDELAFSGEICWGRVKQGTTRNASRILPISLMLREDVPWLRLQAAQDAEVLQNGLSGDAVAIFDLLKHDGALFFNELQKKTRLLPTQLEKSLWELAAAGHVHGDGFSAIRALSKTTAPRAHLSSRKKTTSASLRQRAKRFWGGRPPVTPSSGTGRWGLMSNRDGAATEEAGHPDELISGNNAALNLWAQQLLTRYGVFFRDLLARESAAPPWRDLLPVYRRMEARGEIRGGRFITGVGGEQFALPEVVPLLRQARPQTQNPELVFLSATDPLNLAGILTPGPKVTASASNLLACLGGKIVAHRQGKDTWISPELDPERALELSQALIRLKIK